MAKRSKTTEPLSNTEDNANITKLSEKPMMTQRRKRPHSWPKTIRPPTPIPVYDTPRGRRLTLKEIKSEEEKNKDNRKEIEVYYEPAERESNGIIIGCM